MKPSGRPPSAFGSRDAPIIATLRGRNRASSTGGSLSSPTAGAVLVMTETLLVGRTVGFSLIRFRGHPAALTSGKWQATTWPGLISRICGTTSAQVCWAAGQRVRNRQPDGGLSGEGCRPVILTRSRLTPPRRAGGLAESRAAVYGCAGERE